jgi:hypothetical protein
MENHFAYQVRNGYRALCQTVDPHELHRVERASGPKVHINCVMAPVHGGESDTSQTQRNELVRAGLNHRGYFCHGEDPRGWPRPAEVDPGRGTDTDPFR